MHKVLKTRLKVFVSAQKSLLSILSLTVRVSPQEVFLKNPHLNKLAVLLLLEQRVEPVHGHPVVLLDLRQADPAHGHDGGDPDLEQSHNLLVSLMKVSKSKDCIWSYSKKGSKKVCKNQLAADLSGCKKNLGDDGAKPDRRQMSGRAENYPDSKLTFCSEQKPFAVRKNLLQ